MAGDSPSRDTSSGDPGPALAWQRFTELTVSPRYLLEQPSEAFVELLDPFLANPSRHRRHVRMIIQAFLATRASQALVALPWPMGTTAKRVFRKVGSEQSRELQKKLAALGEELTETVQPADVAIDILPVRELETPEEWTRKGLQLQLMEIKVGLTPRGATSPTGLAVRLRIEDQDAKFVDHYPRNEFEKVGTQEVALTEDGRFVSSTTDAANLGAAVGTHGAKVTAGVSSSESTEVSSGHSASQKLTFTPTVKKIQSYAVGRAASWQLLASDSSAPVGGSDFFVTLLVGGETRAIAVSVEIDAAFDDWGVLRLDHSAPIEVEGAAPASR